MQSELDSYEGDDHECRHSDLARLNAYANQPRRLA